MRAKRFGVLRVCLAMCASLFLSFIISTSSHAQFAASPCDPNYYKSLEARAWLEAQREITQNQNLILKPDSVLEYTCFDKHLGVLAAQAPSMFSETTRWGPVMPAGSMGTALSNLVGAALTAYDTANFSGPMLGGRSSETYTPQASVTAGTYGCETMQKVWQEAKCMNFIDREASDGFFTFAEYASGDDKRALPSPCGRNPDWQKNIDAANAKDDDPWKKDATKTYLNTIFRTSCGGTDDKFNIKTGLRVYRAKGDVQDYFERVCVVPGCYWEPSSANAGKCTGPFDAAASGVPGSL